MDSNVKPAFGLSVGKYVSALFGSVSKPQLLLALLILVFHIYMYMQLLSWECGVHWYLNIKLLDWIAALLKKKCLQNANSRLYLVWIKNHTFFAARNRRESLWGSSPPQGHIYDSGTEEREGGMSLTRVTSARKSSNVRRKAGILLPVNWAGKLFFPAKWSGQFNSYPQRWWTLGHVGLTAAK